MILAEPHIDTLDDLEKFVVAKDDWQLHEIAEATIVLKGKPLSLDRYKLMHPLYDRTAQKALFKTARQATKSTTLANIMALRCFFKGYYNSLYVAPLEQQVYRFSSLYIKPLLKNSYIFRLKTDSDSVKSVLVKSWTNGSTMFFGYCQNGVDRIRSISCDEINWDEVQDILWDHMPIVEECMGASDHKIQRFCGTPKSLENTMEHLWLQTSQNEPVVKCSRCSKHCIPDLDNAFNMIAEKGPQCYHCKRPLSVEDILNVEWVPGDPSREDYFLGYHIPRFLIVQNLTPKNWRNIWEKFTGSNYSKAQFANEVLGLSYDLGGRLITLTELRELCQNDFIDYQKLDKSKYVNICAGVDWGVSGITSFTTIIIIGLKPGGKWDVLYFYRFPHSDTYEQIMEIARLLRAWKVDKVGCDHGVGHTNNNILRRKWCPTQLMKLNEYNYVRANFYLSWNKSSTRYSLNKSMSLNNLFFEMKDKKIIFPKTDKISVVFNDILAEYEEVSEGPFVINKIFRHPPEVPDDFLHALNFAIITSKRMAGMLIVDYKDDELQAPNYNV